MTTILTIPDIEIFKLKLLQWANQFSHFCILDNHENDLFHQRFHFVAAIDQLDFFNINEQNFNAFEKWKSKKNSIVFGGFHYELNHLQHHIPTKNKVDSLGYFFEPRYLFQIHGNKVEINRNYPEAYDMVTRIQEIEIKGNNIKKEPIKLNCKKTKEAYLSDIQEIKEKIAEGTFYEINYCMEWFSENTIIDPVLTFFELNKISKAPFSAFLKIQSQYTICASPERFLQKKGKKLISQPIKGTIKRDKQNAIQDDILKKTLSESNKDKAENIMIVDLVRNDLTPFAETGSIKVTELFGIYAFEFVFQMISTIEANLKKETDGLKALIYAFPPGSMTGAPKHEVMKQIDLYEPFQRVQFSGSIGYIDEHQDFDFNVVIRSCFYNEISKYLSIKSGGAITYESDPESEYQECLLKSEAMMNLFHQSKFL